MSKLGVQFTQASSLDVLDLKVAISKKNVGGKEGALVSYWL
jgi:hypothetical protein